MVMTAVGVRDLKTHLSRYLKQVGAGARLQVTDHGRPVATLEPIQPSADRAWAHRMIAEGRARWNGAKPGGGTHKPVTLKAGSVSASAIVLADRR